MSPSPSICIRSSGLHRSRLGWEPITLNFDRLPRVVVNVNLSRCLGLNILFVYLLCLGVHPV
uniref:Uncharacterized protein n=1 Tax=Anguilla anguilla TaxID=7936 RepID=A0A0E9PEQ4_ANGAN